MPEKVQTKSLGGALLKRCSLKFRKIDRKIPVLRSLFKNVARLYYFIKNFTKKRLWNRSFPVNFEKFIRTVVFIEHIWWLLLVEVKKIFNFPMLHVAIQSVYFLGNFQSSLSNKIWQKYAYIICSNSPVFRRELLSSCLFLKSPISRWSCFECQVFINFSIQSRIL